MKRAAIAATAVAATLLALNAAVCAAANSFDRALFRPDPRKATP